MIGRIASRECAGERAENHIRLVGLHQPPGEFLKLGVVRLRVVRDQR